MTSNHSLPIVIVGHVDHGKSTLIGRLLYDTGSLPEEKIEEIRIASESVGREMEFSFAMDHLEEERQRGITIDIAQTFFNTEKRRYVIIDAPGHKEFLKNMITGSSQAEAALLLVDASEGIRDQTRRHTFILKMLGIKQIAVVVNKMDMVDYSEDKFKALSTEINELFYQFTDGTTANHWLTKGHENPPPLNPLPQGEGRYDGVPIIPPPLTGGGKGEGDKIGFSHEKSTIQPDYIIPISARYGANVAMRAESLKWYSGPTVLEALDSFKPLEVREKSLRFPVQDVYEIGGKKIIAGRVEAGQIKKGEELYILPEGEKTTVISIEKFQEEGIETASTGECIGLCLDKPPVRGQVLIRSHDVAASSSLRSTEEPPCPSEAQGGMKIPPPLNPHPALPHRGGGEKEGIIRALPQGVGRYERLPIIPPPLTGGGEGEGERRAFSGEPPCPSGTQRDTKIPLHFKGRDRVGMGLFSDEPITTREIHANIFWMGNEAYKKGEPVTFKCATQEVSGRIGHIYKRFDPATIEVVENDATEIGAAEIAEVEISLEKPVVVDPFTEVPEMGRFVIEMKGHPVAGGIIL